MGVGREVTGRRPFSEGNQKILIHSVSVGTLVASVCFFEVVV